MPTSKMKTLLRLAMVAGATCSVALIANAREIPFQTPAQLKSACEAGGGDYGAPGGGKGGRPGRGVYTCRLDGATISCGGTGKHAKTCSNTGPTRTGSGGAPTTTKGSGPIVRDHRKPRPGVGGNSGSKPIVKSGSTSSTPFAGGALNVKPTNARFSGTNERSGGRRR